MSIVRGSRLATRFSTPFVSLGRLALEVETRMTRDKPENVGRFIDTLLMKATHVHLGGKKCTSSLSIHLHAEERTDRFRSPPSTSSLANRKRNQPCARAAELTTPKYARESMPTRLPIPTPSAPPEPPSPMMRVTMGTFNPAITVKLVAIASLCPSLSACCCGVDAVWVAAEPRNQAID